MQSSAEQLRGDTSKPSANFKSFGPRSFTLSIALPGSIVGNAQTHDLKTTLAGKIARAGAVFCVDEIVVFDDNFPPSYQPQPQPQSHDPGRRTSSHDPVRFLGEVLAYLETPPYLRKLYWPLLPSLRTAGSLPSLDMPHHQRLQESEGRLPFREGVTIPQNPYYEVGPETTTNVVQIGTSEPQLMDVFTEPFERVTIKLPDPADLYGPHVPPQRKLAERVLQSTPREEAGYYWGYTVRLEKSLSDVFTKCPFVGGYDVSIGTSERGDPLDEVISRVSEYSQEGAEGEKFKALANYKHLLLVFGGLAGLERALAADSELQRRGITNVEEIFDFWVDLCPGQGSKTIRTEEAVWMGLMGISPIMRLRAKGHKPLKRHRQRVT